MYFLPLPGDHFLHQETVVHEARCSSAFWPEGALKWALVAREAAAALG